MNIDDELRQLRGDCVDVSSLNRVRSGVLEQVRIIEQERSAFQCAAIWLWRGFPWRYAILGCAAVIAMSLGLWRIHSSNVAYIEKPQIVAMVPAPKPLITQMAELRPAVKVVKLVHSRGRQSARSKVPVAGADKTHPKEETDTVVQIMTDDPNIVIYWLLDTTGGQ